MVEQTLAVAHNHIQVSWKRNLSGLIIYLITRVYSGLSSLLVQGTILPLGMEEGRHPYFPPGFLIKLEEKTALLPPIP